MNKSTKRFLLTDLEINFVSACPQGANPGAKIILKKEAVMPDDKKEGEGKDININIDIESLSKSLNETLKTSLDKILENKDLSKEAMAEAVVAVISGDIEKMQKSLAEQLTKTIADVQKELDEKIKSQKDVTKEYDESLEMNGTTFKKSIVGGEAFAAIKASFAEQQKLRKEMEDTKRVARVEKEFPNVAGKPEEKAAILELIEKADENVRKTGLAMLKALNDASGEFAKEIGGNGNGRGSEVSKLATDNDATMKLQKMAEDYAAEKGVDVWKAWDIVANTPEGRKLYEEHSNAQDQ